MHSSSTPDQTNADKGLIYPAIVALASVLRGIVSFRGPGRRAGRVYTTLNCIEFVWPVILYNAHALMTVYSKRTKNMNKKSRDAAAKKYRYKRSRDK